MSDAWIFILLGACAFILGLRGSIRLSRRYVDVRTLLVDRERLFLLSLVWVSWVITFAGGFFVLLSARRVIGLEPLPFSPILSILVAATILFIPAGLDQVVSRVARVPWS